MLQVTQHGSLFEYSRRTGSLSLQNLFRSGGQNRLNFVGGFLLRDELHQVAIKLFENNILEDFVNYTVGILETNEFRAGFIMEDE